ncbi:MAG: argininosuccinate synthase, partial [Bdellovibrionaceae bacterium]|nr:argininosuccinate synthase [Pseudobdellovibrionaceae bacterium]
MKKKIVLAYSGGLDTSAIIPWLIETYDAEIIAYCSDLGNAPDEDFIGKRAFELGAKEFIFEDLKDLYTK